MPRASTIPLMPNTTTPTANPRKTRLNATTKTSTSTKKAATKQTATSPSTLSQTTRQNELEPWVDHIDENNAQGGALVSSKRNHVVDPQTEETTQSSTLTTSPTETILRKCKGSEGASSTKGRAGRKYRRESRAKMVWSWSSHRQPRRGEKKALSDTRLQCAK